MALSLSFPAGGMLVTGGTGNVGGGIVRCLADAGVPLVFTYNSNAEKAAAIEEAMVRDGHRVWSQPMDMRDTGSIASALDRVIAECGAIHGVACGSGLKGGLNRLLDFTVDHAERHVLGDALGYYRLMHEAIPRLRRSGGSVTLCSTMATRRTLRFDGMSPLSKGSVDAMTRQIALEEAEFGIRCNAVSIGWIEERSWADILAQTPSQPPSNPRTRAEHVAGLVRKLIDTVPLGRAGRPEEAGSLFAFLASEQASYITGQNIVIDGGMTL